MFLEKLKHIKLVILDIDGVLTDASVLVTESGEQLRKFNVRDGYAIKCAISKGIKIIIISGGTSESVRFRLNFLGINDIYLGAHDKIGPYNDAVNKFQISPEEILYMGDDLPDIPVMERVGIATCPSDAVDEVKSTSLYISDKKGGEGCVRDVLEKVLKTQGLWPQYINNTFDNITSE